MQVTKTDREIIDEYMDNATVFIDNLPKVEGYEIRHIFNPGVYIRQAVLPAGAILTSMVHKHQHTFIVSEGRILVVDGIHEPVVLKASFTGTTMANSRRMGIAIEETVWSTIHPTNITPETDSAEDVAIAVDLIQKEMIVPYTSEILETKTMTNPNQMERLLH